MALLSWYKWKGQYCICLLSLDDGSFFHSLLVLIRRRIMWSRISARSDSLSIPIRLQYHDYMRNQRSRVFRERRFDEPVRREKSVISGLRGIIFWRCKCFVLLFATGTNRCSNGSGDHGQDDEDTFTWRILSGCLRFSFWLCFFATWTRWRDHMDVKSCSIGSQWRRRPISISPINWYSTTISKLLAEVQLLRCWFNWSFHFVLIY